MNPSDRSLVGVLLPLAAGLASLGVWALGFDSGISTVAAMAIFLALGAALPERPWRTAAIASTPGLVVALVRAGSDSMGLLLVVVATSPLYVALAALLVKGGTLLVARAGARPSAVPTTVSGRAQPRRRAFETKEQRGRFLVILALLLFIAGVALSRWGAGEADRQAEVREGQIRTALVGQTPESLRVDGVTTAFGDGPDLPGGPYDTAALGPDRFEATVELQVRLQYRCISIEVTADGALSTEVERNEC